MQSSFHCGLKECMLCVADVFKKQLLEKQQTRSALPRTSATLELIYQGLRRTESSGCEDGGGAAPVGYRMTSSSHKNSVISEHSYCFNAAKQVLSFFAPLDSGLPWGIHSHGHLGLHGGSPDHMAPVCSPLEAAQSSPGCVSASPSLESSAAKQRY